MKCFLLTWNLFYYDPDAKSKGQKGRFDLLVKRQTILSVLDDMPSIVVNWRAAGGAIFLVSNHSAKVISDEISQNIPKLIFAIAQVDSATTNGRLDKKTWDFIKNPRPAEN